MGEYLEEYDHARLHRGLAGHTSREAFMALASQPEAEALVSKLPGAAYFRVVNSWPWA